MKITLLTYGTRGDVQPFAALGRGLQRAGHTVRLAAPHRFADFAAQHSLPFAALPGDPEEISRRVNDAGSGALGMVKSMADYVFSIADGVFRASFAACEDADLIVHTFLFTTGAHTLARTLGIPDVSLQLFPIFAPTRAFPNVALPRIQTGAPSYFSHWLVTEVFWHVGNMGYRRLRRADPDLLNLSLHWPFDGLQTVRTPLLFAYSPAVLPRPADWTAPHIHVTGYLFLDTPETYVPPPQLAAFLAAGEPPVCVSFGSMVNQEAGRIDGIVRAALERTRQRGVILAGWGGTKPDAQDDTLLYMDGAPHDWLFPRCKTVIHHGGVGTTAAGLRAGIPHVVVPHAVDQPFWGRRVAAIGAGPTPLDLKHLTVESLTRALAQADDPALRARAQAVGRQIRAEDGIGEAVRLIEEHANAFNDAHPN
jgi:sterol 3beta-glucosyltransferase